MKQMKKVVALILVGMLLAAGSGLTTMQGYFWGNGEASYYQEDIAEGIGMQILDVYNEDGYTEVLKAIAAEKTECTDCAPRMSIRTDVNLTPAEPPPCPPPVLPDPYEYFGWYYGPDSRGRLESELWTEGTYHYTQIPAPSSGSYAAVGEGGWGWETSGDSAIRSQRITKLAPRGVSFLPAPSLSPPPTPYPGP